MSNEVNIHAVGVKLQSLTKIFLSSSGKKDFVAVNNVELEVKPGELVTLLGPSGCGKTTILRMLSGFTAPTHGQVFFGEREVTNVPPNQRDVGMMFQSYALFPHLSVYENIAYGLRVKKVPEKELKRRMNAALALMQIEEFADRIPEQLSGGQQQRVALARAIVTEPHILLFDEPLSNLDAKMREYMRGELRKLQQRLGITSVYVTHDQAEAMAISDRVVIMNAGQIEQIGTPYEIYTLPNNKFVAYFMGKANFVETRVGDISAGAVEVPFAGKTLRLKPNRDITLKPGDAVSLMIRPEFLHLDENGAFEALIKQASYFGSAVEYTLEIGGETLLMTDADVNRNGIRAEGESIRVSLDDSLIRLLVS